MCGVYPARHSRKIERFLAKYGRKIERFFMVTNSVFFFAAVLGFLPIFIYQRPLRNHLEQIPQLNRAYILIDQFTDNNTFPVFYTVLLTITIIMSGVGLYGSINKNRNVLFVYLAFLFLLWFATLFIFPIIIFINNVSENTGTNIK